MRNVRMVAAVDLDCRSPVIGGPYDVHARTFGDFGEAAQAGEQVDGPWQPSRVRGSSPWSASIMDGNPRRAAPWMAVEAWGYFRGYLLDGDGGKRYYLRHFRCNCVPSRPTI